jgi:hypothetical protein
VQPPFELVRFTAGPASPEIALVELEGRLEGARSRRFAPTLVVEGVRGRVEAPAVTWQEGAGGRPTLRATFAVPLDVALDDTGWALDIGRGPLLALPAPDVVAGGAGDAQVRLARQLNALRSELDAEREARREAEERAVREHAAGDERAARARGQAEGELAAVREEAARAEAERERELALVRERATAELTRVREEAEREVALVHERGAQELLRAREEAGRAREDAGREAHEELERGRAEVARLRTELDRAHDEVERVRAQEHATATARLDEEIMRARDAVTQAQLEIDAARDEAQAARAERDAARAERAGAGAESDAARARHEATRAELERLRREAREGRVELERVRAEAREGATELVELRRQLAEARRAQRPLDTEEEAPAEAVRVLRASHGRDDETPHPREGDAANAPTTIAGARRQAREAQPAATADAPTRVLRAERGPRAGPDDETLDPAEVGARWIRASGYARSERGRTGGGDGERRAAIALAALLGVLFVALLVLVFVVRPI